MTILNDTDREKEKILRVFDKNKQLMIEAMERTQFGNVFNIAKLVNAYITTTSEPTMDGFKVYLFDYLEKNYGWGGGGFNERLWQEIMLNYELLKRMEAKNAKTI